MVPCRVCGCQIEFETAVRGSNHVTGAQTEKRGPSLGKGAGLHGVALALIERACSMVINSCNSHQHYIAILNLNNYFGN